tara:strand:+ start:28005 stop:28880 length:876 start_codon:yes stop_codon:yes gene_type:complete
MVYVSKKKVGKKDYYYYLVRSSRPPYGKITKYFGNNKPSKEDIDRFKEEHGTIKLLLDSKKEILDKLKESFNKKVRGSTKDELRKFKEELMIQFTYDTSRIEGSSLSYEDTRMLFKHGINPKKNLRDVRETEHHKRLFEYIWNGLDRKLNKELILDLHRILKKDITEDAGKFRDRQVMVGNLVPVKASMVEKELDDLIEWYEKNCKIYPIELASIFHANFERIHPFFDGNGRVGRLLLNFILLKMEFPLVIIQNKNKRRYYNALRRADDGEYYYLVKYVIFEMENMKKFYR